MRRVITTGCLLYLTACAPQPYTPPGAAVNNISQDWHTRARASAEWSKNAIARGERRPITIAEAEQSIRSSMADREAVRFTNVRRNPENGAVCGEYNGKNSYGAYVGARNFIVHHAADTTRPYYWMTDQGTGLTALTANAYVEAYCPPGANLLTTDAPATPPRRGRT